MSIKIPFAYSVFHERIIGIDEAISGANGYYCMSCKMELQARKGFDRTWHFSHHKKAEVECDISYWVSVRDIMLNTLKEHVGGTIFIPPLNSHKLSFPNIITLYDVVNTNKSDLLLFTNIGDIHIYIITPEHHPVSINEDLSNFFTKKLSLMIEPLSMPDKHNEAMRYIRHILFEKASEKRWVQPVKKITDSDPFEIELNRFGGNQTHKYESPINHNKIFATFGVKMNKVSREDRKTCERLIPFFKRASKEYKKLEKDQQKEGVHLFKENSKLWAYARNGHLKFIAYMACEYFAYTVINNEVVFCAVEITRNTIVRNLENPNYYPDTITDSEVLDF